MTEESPEKSFLNISNFSPKMTSFNKVPKKEKKKKKKRKKKRKEKEKRKEKKKKFSMKLFAEKWKKKSASLHFSNLWEILFLSRY
jgi:hypothetical protein